VLLAALDESNADWATAEALGHEIGSDAWEEWTAASGQIVVAAVARQEPGAPPPGGFVRTSLETPCTVTRTGIAAAWVLGSKM